MIVNFGGMILTILDRPEEGDAFEYEYDANYSSEVLEVLPYFHKCDVSILKEKKK